MKAAYIERVGPPESIRFGDLPTPTPTGAQILVKVAAVAVNPIDAYIRAGAVAMNLPTPFILGADLAGIVEAVGPEARRFAPGDSVWGSNQGMFGRQGVFAEYAAVDEQWLYPLPKNIDPQLAAAGALVGITAYLGLFEFAQLKEKETVFVPGGSGGVGSAVIQLSKAAGARVVSTAADARRAEICRANGADGVILYANEDVPQRIRDLAPGGVDVWFENRREPDFLSSIPLLAPRGRFIIMAGRDAQPPFPVGSFYTRDCKLLGFAMFNAAADKQRECASRLNALFESGAYQPRVGRLFPLAEAAKAHQLQEDNTLRRAGTLAGKIVLTP